METLISSIVTVNADNYDETFFSKMRATTFFLLHYRFETIKCLRVYI